jgi:hypothetical protein
LLNERLDTPVQREPMFSGLRKMRMVLYDGRFYEGDDR